MMIKLVLRIPKCADIQKIIFFVMWILKYILSTVKMANKRTKPPRIMYSVYTIYGHGWSPDKVGIGKVYILQGKMFVDTKNISL